ATLAVSKAAEYIRDKVSGLGNGKVTNTISPGNCGWPVEEQEKLLGLLPESFLGITLNSSGMMYPVKSLSGIIGTGEKVKFKQTECRYCRSRNCPYRKEEYSGKG
ncbi:MAG: methionine synthase, partial [Chlorobi bacterium]|nr:methionine synthase [Chlorobiota bacterium]